VGDRFDGRQLVRTWRLGLDACGGLHDGQIR
jgi:hypothetical protein